MSHIPKIYIVAYDISDSKRLRKVYRCMRGWGDHLQYSVFRCRLSAKQLALMETELEEIIKATEDQVLIIPLGEAGAKHRQMYTLGLSLIHPERVVRVF